MSLTSETMIWCGLLTIWTRCVATSPLLRLRAQAGLGAKWSRSPWSCLPEMPTRTEKYMRYYGGAPTIVHTSVSLSKY